MEEKVKLIKHNSQSQMRWGSNADTRKYLKVGKTYDALEEIHSWHTKIIIKGKSFNSVCFKDITP